MKIEANTIGYSSLQALQRIDEILGNEPNKTPIKKDGGDQLFFEEKTPKGRNLISGNYIDNYV